MLPYARPGGLARLSPARTGTQPDTAAHNGEHGVRSDCRRETAKPAQQPLSPARGPKRRDTRRTRARHHTKPQVADLRRKPGAAGETAPRKPGKPRRRVVAHGLVQWASGWTSRWGAYACALVRIRVGPPRSSGRSRRHWTSLGQSTPGRRPNQRDARRDSTDSSGGAPLSERQNPTAPQWIPRLERQPEYPDSPDGTPTTAPSWGASLDPEMGYLPNPTRNPALGWLCHPNRSGITTPVRHPDSGPP